MSGKSVPKKGYKSTLIEYSKRENIPVEWEVQKISEICDIKSGNGFPLQYQNGDNGKIPFIKVSDMNEPENSIYVSRSTNSITSQIANLIPAKIFPENTIIFPKIGATIFTHKRGILKTESCYDNNLMGLIPKKICYKFLYFWMDRINLEYFVQTTALPYLNDKIVGELKLPIPSSLPEQQKIASILSNVHNLIQNTDKLIEKTTRLKKGLMQKLLTKGIGHTKFKKVKWYFGKEIEMPEEWEVEKIQNINEKLVVGYVGSCDRYYVKENGIAILRTTNVKEGKLDLSNLKYVTKEFHEKNKKSQVKENDLLVSRHGQSGESCLVKGLKHANCLNVVIVHAKDDVLDHQYFEITFNSPIVRKQISRTTAGGVQGVVNTSEIKKLKIPVPPLPEQQKITSILSNTDEKIQSYGRYKEKLQRLKRSLMQKLLTGEVRVAV